MWEGENGEGFSYILQCATMEICCHLTTLEFFIVTVDYKVHQICSKLYRSQIYII